MRYSMRRKLASGSCAHVSVCMYEYDHKHAHLCVCACVCVYVSLRVHLFAVLALCVCACIFMSLLECSSGAVLARPLAVRSTGDFRPARHWEAKKITAAQGDATS